MNIDQSELQRVAQTIATGSVQFSYCSAYKTRQLAKLVMLHFEASVKSLGIKGTQFSLLGFIQRDGPIKPTDLANIMGLSTSTLSRNMQPLIAQGWLALGQGIDGRSRILKITPTGRQMFLRAAKRWQQAQSSLGEQVGLEDLATLHCIIDGALKKL
jgi:DNA-binding MarR family transcriptional regulator